MDALLTVGDETMDDQFVSIGKAAKMIGMSIDGLRKWASAGILLPVRTLTNTRRYRVTDLRALMGEDPSPAARDTRCILYARVSTRKQPEAGTSDRQLGRLPSFAAEPQGTVIAALPDVARGLNEQRRGLRQLLSLPNFGIYTLPPLTVNCERKAVVAALLLKGGIDPVPPKKF